MEESVHVLVDVAAVDRWNYGSVWSAVLRLVRVQVVLLVMFDSMK